MIYIVKQFFYIHIYKYPGGGHGNPLQYFCLENPLDRGTWQAMGHGVTKSQDTTDYISVYIGIYLPALSQIPFHSRLSHILGTVPRAIQEVLAAYLFYVQQCVRRFLKNVWGGGLERSSPHLPTP